MGFGLQIPLDGSLLEDSSRRECRCWSWEGPAQDQGSEAAEWLSDFLGAPVRLMRYTGGSPATASSLTSFCANSTATRLT